MLDFEWDEVRHFTKNENWGDASKMSLQFLLCLDSFRDKLGKSIVITCGTQGEHVTGSHHSEGFAVDCVIPDINLIDGFINAVRFPFTGIGIYPDWEYLGKRIGGFHFELVSNMTVVPKKLWMGIGLLSRQEYIAVTYQNLKGHCDY